MPRGRPPLTKAKRNTKTVSTKGAKVKPQAKKLVTPAKPLITRKVKAKTLAGNPRTKSIKRNTALMQSDHTQALLQEFLTKGLTLVELVHHYFTQQIKMRDTAVTSTASPPVDLNDADQANDDSLKFADDHK